ncbi:MAG: two-component system response regulator [Frankiales bacterium]|nr:two-component system response regulator [Frankiales bacterium]
MVCRTRRRQLRMRRRRMLRIVLYEPSRLLANALAFELRGRGHTVHVAPQRPDLIELAVRQFPDVVVVGDFLDGHEARRLAIEVAHGARVPVLVVADDVEVESSIESIRVVGSGRPLRAVVHAIEDLGNGLPVREIDVQVAPRRSGSPALSPREREVISLLVEGRSTGSIASELRVSANTARTYVQRVLQKLGAHSRIEAVSISRVAQAERRHDPRRAQGQ